MIDRQALLEDLQALLPKLEDDIRERLGEVATLDEGLRAEHAAAREAGRTAQAYEDWREEPITQAAVAWILATVFVRFLEDNGLVETPRLAGPAERLRLARDHHTVFFQRHPSETDREYLLDVFRDVAGLPAARDLFDERHNPLWSLQPSGDGAHALLEFWQAIDPATGAILRDFTDPGWDTRFLGDLYQDLSEAARKRYALLQTPEFIEQFLLDRTLGPAIEEFGYREVRLLDPTCGSGHLLLGAFRRLLDLRLKHEPAVIPRDLVQRALDAVFGVDLNPFATAIARFRLLLAALKACGLTRLKDAPAFRINVATGDSLLHGPRFSAIAGVQATLDPAEDPLRHVYAAEDRDALRRILGQQYHAVVGNPPYITVKDKALNEAYRQKYGSCHRQYSLSVPFMERFWELALPGREGQPAGFVGQITANSFMKREFGSKLIESLIPKWDLTHVIDASGAYIPGHGTPTVILFGRNRRPVRTTVRAVMGIRGEPTAPEEPARGLVWTAITAQVDRPGSLSEWVSVADTPRASFHKHPWSIGGGGAKELKEFIEEHPGRRLAEAVESPIGRAVRIAEEEAFMYSPDWVRRHGFPQLEFRGFLIGEGIRDWSTTVPDVAWYPYTPEADRSPLMRWLWPWRAMLANRSTFQGDMAAAGLRWYEYMQHTASAYRTPLSIAFAFVATHNHFVLDRGGKVFNRTAPVIKLPATATEDDHLGLLGLLNSSTACFWMKQTFFDKGVGGIGGGIGDEKWEPRFEHDGTKLQAFPLTAERPLTLARRLDALASGLAGSSPIAVAGRGAASASALAEAGCQHAALIRQMVAAQEELDWHCYRLYDLLDEGLTSPYPESVPEVHLGERAFEIVLARRVAAGEIQTTWFERHGSTPITEVPAHWPEDYRRLVERRIQAIETNTNIRLIEQPEYKRRWNLEPWESQQERALRGWLLDRLESPAYWPEPAITTCARLADRANADSEFMQVGELYRGRADFDVTELVKELVASEAVPFLPVLRYKDTGLRKRALWEETWDLQRREDRGEKVGDIPVPPKYTSADFASGPFWRLRGKLDVPKERFISYPGCERDADPTPLMGWAGWDHLQQAQALAGHYVAMKDTEGWPPERLTPLLAGLLELLPWLHQWHSEPDPTLGMGMAEYFSRFLDEEARSQGSTIDAVRGWKPAAGRLRAGPRRRRAPTGNAR